jgi:hypothetical protein
MWCDLMQCFVVSEAVRVDHEAGDDAILYVEYWLEDRHSPDGRGTVQRATTFCPNAERVVVYTKGKTDTLYLKTNGKWRLLVIQKMRPLQ